jgi:hypothetical protein
VSLVRLDLSSAAIAIPLAKWSSVSLYPVFFLVGVFAQIAILSVPLLVLSRLPSFINQSSSFVVSLVDASCPPVLLVVLELS